MNEQNALLFSLQFGVGRRSQQDKETTVETEVRKNAESGACAVRVNFFPKNAFKPLLDVQRKWADEIDRLTLPWEGTIRLCPAAAQPRVQAVCDWRGPEMSEVKRRLLDDEYAGWLATAPTRLGALYKPDDFPSVEALTESIFARCSFLPLPEAANIRLRGLTPEQLADVQGRVAQELEERFAAGQRETWRRILEPVQRFVERLSKPDAIITQPSIAALREIVQLTSTVNLDSAELEAFRTSVESQLTRWDAEVIRHNKGLRQELASSGQQLLAQFGRMGARKFNLAEQATESAPQPEVIAARGTIPPAPPSYINPAHRLSCNSRLTGAAAPSTRRRLIWRPWAG